MSLVSENNGDSCNTPGCITAAHTLIQNMDPSADPCEDFYQYACGGFEERVSFKWNRKKKFHFRGLFKRLKSTIF